MLRKERIHLDPKSCSEHREMFAAALSIGDARGVWQLSRNSHPPMHKIMAGSR